MTEVGRISIKVVPDMKEFREELYGELKKDEEGAKVKVGADFDAKDLKAKIDALTKGDGAKVKVKADLDQTSFERMLAFTKAQAKAAGVNLKVDFRDKEAEAGLALLIGKLKAEAKAADIKLNVSTDTRRGFLGDLGQTLLGRGATSAGGGFSGGAGGLGSIGNFGSPANLLALLTLLPPALAIAAPAIASLPAALSAVALPIGTVVLGMDGLKKAAEDVGLEDVKKGKTPFDKDKLTAGGALKQLKDGVSDVFEKGFTPILKELIPLAPQVTTALKGVAQGIVNLADGAVKALIPPAAQNQLNTLSANIGGLLGAAAPGLQSFTTGLINLATQVSTHFPGMASWFNQLGDKFSNWVSKISADGTLDKAVAGLGPITDSLLNFVGQMMDQGIKLASDPKNIKAITDLLNSITTLTVDALPGLAKAFVGLSKAVTDITGALDKIDKWGKEHPGAKGPLDRIGSILGGEPDKSSPQVQSGEGFDFEHSNVNKLIQQGGKNLEGLASPGGKLNAFGLQIPTGEIVSQAQNAVSQVAGVFRGLPGAISGIWSGIVAEASSAMSKFVSAVSTGISQAISFFTSLPGKAVAAVQSMGSQLSSAGAAAMQQLNKGLQSVPIVGPMISGLEGILKNVPHSPAEEGPMSGSGWTALFTGGQAIGNQFKSGLENGFQGVITSATELVGQVHNAMANGAIPPDLKKNVQQELKDISKEMDNLRVQRDALDPKDKAGRKGISDQLHQLQTLRDQLKQGEDNLPGDKKGTSDKDMDPWQEFGKELQKIPGVGASFAEANLNQFEQDLGWSGKGAIPTITNAGVSWLTQTLSNLIGQGFDNKNLSGKDAGVHIHVNDVSSAVAAHQAVKNKEAMSYSGGPGR